MEVLNFLVFCVLFTIGFIVLTIVSQVICSVFILFFCFLGELSGKRRGNND